MTTRTQNPERRTPMNPLFEHHLLQTRRQFFGDAGCGWAVWRWPC